MLISNEFVFIHNPKAGGTAIRTALEPFARESRWHQGSDGYFHIMDMAHQDRSERDKNARDAIRDARFAFMIVRDPIERFLSGFSEHCRQHERGILDVNDFIDREVTYGNLWHDWRYIHMRPQWTFLDEHVHVYRHESLGEEWPNICAKAVGKIMPLTVSRKDPGMKPSKDQLAVRSFEKLARVYAVDYLAFGQYYTPPTIIKTDGSHSVNMEFVHSPLRDGFLDLSQLRPGELLGFHGHRYARLFMSGYYIRSDAQYDGPVYGKVQ